VKSELQNNDLRLRSIRDLINTKEKFYIPSYQRGYRWTEQQVLDLLNDILEFRNKKSGFYCLQPVVVKKLSNGYWELLDGQQRLTTLFIILKYFEGILSDDYFMEEIYSISYQTRETKENNSKDFLESINKIDSVCETNIDYFHMSKAHLTIKEWFKEKITNREITKSQFLDLLITSEVKEEGSILIDGAKNVRVIWYEVEDNNQNEIDIFTRINMGKIPLTNAELIKALLLKSDDKFKDNSKFEIATEWDLIEYSLQNDEFWYFLNSDDDKSTRIEFIFEFIIDKYIKEYEITNLNKSIDSYYTFHVFNEVLTTNKKDRDAIWKDVKSYFRTFNEWFENRELFHKIGFLISENKSIIQTLIDKSKNSSKSEFKSFLDQKIKEKLKKEYGKKNIDELEFENSKEAIKQTLLLFNIQTLLNNEKSNMRFQFDRFKKENWDIEHIRSQNDKKPIKKADKKDWLDDMESLNLEALINIDKEDIIEDKQNDVFNTLYENIEEMFGENKVFDKASISNLALLDAGTNRSYKNAFFPIKRNIILQNDMNGIFIPICTRNAFVKYYTKNIQDIRTWKEEDAEDYLNAIKITLKNYLPNQDVENAE
jgi:hypothetical protein